MLGLVACDAVAKPKAAGKAEAGKKLAEVRPATEAEVRGLLSDVVIGPECCDAAEAYFRDSRYVKDGDRVERSRYPIVGKLVCAPVYDGQINRSHQVYVDLSGDFY